MAEDRLTLLCQQTLITGIDFVAVADPEVQTTLRVFTGGQNQRPDLMRKLFDDYQKANPSVKIDIVGNEPHDFYNRMGIGRLIYDGEGLAARRNVLIDGGVLQGFVHNSYSARRAGTTSTGNAVRGGFKGTPGVGCLAMQVQPGTRTQDELIADITDGVLVQQVSGLHSGVNPISGDFSTGASGLLISNGQVGAPVREFTIASTLQRMLLDLIEVGGDVDWLPMRAAGVSLVIGDMTMSGA